MNVQKQTLLIVGSTAIGSLASSYHRAFRHLGWNVYIWNPTEALRQVVRGGRIGHLAMTFLGVEPWRIKANLPLLQQANNVRPTLILVIDMAHIRFGTLVQIRACVPGILIYGLFPDAPYKMTTTGMQCVPGFDRMATSSPAWIEAFERLGARHVHYLPFAADIEFHYPVSASRQPSSFTRDVLFVGNWRDERETMLEQLTDLDLGIWERRTGSGSPGVVPRCVLAGAGANSLGSNWRKHVRMRKLCSISTMSPPCRGQICAPLSNPPAGRFRW